MQPSGNRLPDKILLAGLALPWIVWPRGVRNPPRGAAPRPPRRRHFLVHPSRATTQRKTSADATTARICPLIAADRLLTNLSHPLPPGVGPRHPRPITLTPRSCRPRTVRNSPEGGGEAKTTLPGPGWVWSRRYDARICGVVRVPHTPWCHVATVRGMSGHARSR
jgi:hypothetical protein